MLDVPGRFAAFSYGASVNLMCGELVLVIGGHQLQDIKDVIVVCTLSDKIWRETRIARTPNVCCHATCVAGNTLYVHGGLVNSQVMEGFYQLDTCDGLTISGATDLSHIGDHFQWTALPVLPAGRRVRHTLTADSGSGCVYLFGGMANNRKCTNDMAEYNPSSQSWRMVTQTGSVPTKRSRHSMTSLGNGRLLLLGGDTDDNTPLADVHEYHVSKSTWTEVVMKGVAPAMLAMFSATLMKDGCIIILGGSGEGPQGLCVNLVAKTWGSLPDSVKPVERRCGHAAILWENKLLVVGGTNRGVWDASILEYDVEPPAFQKGPAISASTPKCYVDLSASLRSTKHSDAAIILDDATHIPVHSIVLVTRCPYFDNLLSNREIRIFGVGQHTMMQVLTYIYTGVFPDTEAFEETVSVYEVAHRFELQGLKEHAANRLIVNIDLNNLTELLNLGNKTNSDKIVQVCSEYLKTHEMKMKQ